MTAASQFAQLAKAAAREAGFDLCGVAAISEAGMRELSRFPDWIDSGCAGEMEYMKARGADGTLKRASPRSTVPWAQSVIVCAMNYDSEQPYSTEVAEKRRGGWIARYAWSQQDYHDVLLARLRKVEAKIQAAAASQDLRDVTTRCYVDTGPHIERIYAKYAGIGWIGKNTCILNQQLGSWIFLGIILTSLDLPSDLPAADRCGTCTRCIEACPTQALIEPYKLDATRCISYLTIEKRGEIPVELRRQMGNHVFGCDICQDVCPWNDGTNRHPFATTPELQPREELVNPALDWLAEMSREEFQKTFRGSPLKRAKYSGLRRNVAVAMGNSGRSGFSSLLEQLANDEDMLVAEHARWALSRLQEK